VAANDPQRKIRTVIVDDEPLARSNVAILLRRDSEIVIVGECNSGADALREIRSLQPDLLFLDVQMPECDGFDVLEMLGGDSPAAIIFVTAYDQYALRAFEAGALDYLLKPFDNARFERALERAKQKIASGKDRSTRVERLAIQSAGQVIFVNVTDIDWIEAADYYAAIHVAEKTHLLRRSLADLERDLDPAIFCRIHRSTIVNLGCVRGLKSGEDGEYIVQLKQGVSLRLSRRYRKELRSRLGISGPD
jgi:two-component system, LytTR family, response regulator